MQIREDLYRTDYDAISGHFNVLMGRFCSYFERVWGQQQNVYAEMLDAEIDKEDALGMSQTLRGKLESNVKLYKRLYAKFKEQKETVLLEGCLKLFLSP